MQPAVVRCVSQLDAPVARLRSARGCRSLVTLFVLLNILCPFSPWQRYVTTNVTQRILVTGGCGFLGNHLCDRLLRDGHDVICLDNFFHGDKANVDHFARSPRFELMRHGTFPLYVEVDQIYNLACPPSPFTINTTPSQNHKTSVLARQHARARQAPMRASFRQSTSEVHSDPSIPQTESYWGNVNPIGIRSC